MPKFFDKLDQIDAALSLPPSSEVLRDTISPLLKNDVIAEYFYDSLPNLPWLELLFTQGLFWKITTKTPRLVAAAQLRCLAKISITDPKSVSDLLPEIEIQDDPWVLQPLLLLLLSLPEVKSASIVENSVIDKDSVFVDWQCFDLLSRLSIKLAQADFIKAVSHILDFVVRPNQVIASYELEKFLSETVQKILSSVSHPVEIVSVLADAVSYYLKEKENSKPEDYSYIWRPAIEEHEQNQGYGSEFFVISALRDSALWCAIEKKQAIPILEKFESINWNLFVRLSLFLVSEIKDPGSIELSKQYLFDETKIVSEAFWHEYSILLRSKYSSLIPQDKEEWLKLLQSSVRSATLFDDPNVVLRDRLALIQGSLSSESKTLLKGLEINYGPAIHPEFLRYIEPVESYRQVSNINGNDPITEAEFLALLYEGKIADSMSADSGIKNWIIARLHNWVASNPLIYSKLVLASLELIPPELFNSILNGFDLAIRMHPTFNIEASMRLIELVSSDLIENRTASSFLYDVLSQSRKSLNVDRDKVILWNSIEFLCKTLSDPQADKSCNPSSNSSLALNSTRGQALHAAFHYMFWLKSHHSMKIENLESFFALIDSRLDLAVETSCAIRSVCGEWLPWLIELDQVWVKSRTQKFFPDGDYGDAVWFAYLYRNPLYKSCFPLLEDQYRKSVGLLFARETMDDEIAKRLTGHIFNAYLIGLIPQAEPSIVKLFYENAPKSMRQYSIDFLLTISESEDLSKEQLSLIADLWIARLEVNDLEIMPMIDQVFISTALDPEWRIRQLEFVLAREIVPREIRRILSELATLSESFTGETLTILGTLAKLCPIWQLQISQSEVTTILSAALSSDDVTRARAIELVDLLGSVGLLSLRPLAVD